jgi:ribonucleoside-diphosphate reductase alpha chain
MTRPQFTCVTKMSEIKLPSDENHTFTCVLSSMNIAKYDEWKDTDAVFTATVFLDCVASEFISKASHIKGLEKAVAFTKKARALGL